jgi:hypothetical protein
MKDSMSMSLPGHPPKSVVTTLRVEGFAALAASVIAYWFLGGNWWVFAVLLLAPDLAFIAYTAGASTGARVYNLAHNYAVPAVLGAVGWFGAMPLLVELALIWTAHIGADRALGYGLKYPGYDHQTHLGPIGKARKLADAR